MAAVESVAIVQVVGGIGVVVVKGWFELLFDPGTCVVIHDDLHHIVIVANKIWS